MNVSGWNDGGNTYGLRVGKRNRDEFFNPGWTEIEVEMDGRGWRFRLTPGFWKHCPEFRDCGQPLIREWLARHRLSPWPKGEPPRAELIPLGKNRFRLVP